MTNKWSCLLNAIAMTKDGEWWRSEDHLSSLTVNLMTDESLSHSKSCTWKIKKSSLLLLSHTPLPKVPKKSFLLNEKELESWRLSKKFPFLKKKCVCVCKSHRQSNVDSDDNYDKIIFRDHLLLSIFFLPPFTYLLLYMIMQKTFMKIFGQEC